MLILHGIQPDREIQRGDTAALWGSFRFDAVAFSGDSQRLGKDRKFVQLRGISPALDPLGMHPLMLGTPLGCIRILRSLVSSAARRRQNPAWDS